VSEDEYAGVENEGASQCCRLLNTNETQYYWSPQCLSPAPYSERSWSHISKIFDYLLAGGKTSVGRGPVRQWRPRTGRHWHTG